jgi:hypothetical protein
MQGIRDIKGLYGLPHLAINLWIVGVFTLGATIINLPLGFIEHSLTPLWIAVCANFCFITFFTLYLCSFHFPFSSRVETDLDISTCRGLALPGARLRTDLVEDPHPLALRDRHPAVRVDCGGSLCHLGYGVRGLRQVRGALLSLSFSTASKHCTDPFLRPQVIVKK